MPTPEFGWLAQDVPLWAFLAALLTSPSKWSQRLSDRVDPLLDRIVPGGGGETETNRVKPASEREEIGHIPGQDPGGDDTE